MEPNFLPQNNFWVPITPEKPLSSITTSTITQYESPHNQFNSYLFSHNLEFTTPIPNTQFRIPLIEEQINDSQLSLLHDNVDDLYGLSCSQILGLADFAAAPIPIADVVTQPQNHQFHYPPSSAAVAGVSLNHNHEAAIPRLEKETSETPPVHSRNKKRKLGLDLNKKPREKRPNKYYWPKIDVQKAPNPKLKTPKAQAPKVTRKKSGKKVVDVPEIPKHVLHETKRDPICKKTLNFEKSEKINLEDGEAKLVLKQTAVVPVVDNEGEKLDRNKGAESLKVYRRTSDFKCLNYCRKIGPSFPGICKKRRAHRNRKPIGDLKPFKEFNFNLILKDFLDQITLMKGKTGMLLPSKIKVIEDYEEPFKCTLSILSSSVKLRKKRRSVKKLTSTKNNVNQLVNPGSTMPSFCTPAVKSFGGDHDVGSLSDDIQKSFAMHEGLGHERLVHVTSCGQASERLASSGCSTPNSCLTKESKTEDRGKKTKRTYKRKEKRIDYLSGINDWYNISIQQLDPFIQDFQSLKLYDDPKKLERWSIIVSGQSNQGDGADLNVEDTHLHERIARFLWEMTNFQGHKDFVKWNGSVLDSVVGVFLTQNVSDVLSSNAYMLLASRFPLKPINQDKDTSGDSEIISSQGSLESTASTVNPIVELPPDEEEETNSTGKEYDSALKDMLASLPDLQGNKGKEKKGDEKENFDWDAIRVQFLRSNERNPDNKDSVDWEAVRNAPVKHIADAIESRGQHRIIAAKIQKVLNRLVNDHKTMDLEWLRNAPPEVAKAYLLSFYGLGLKSVECLRLLTLHHHGFPVDVNIARISIRLGWVPLKPLPVGLPFHLLEKYPLENDIQQYLWPRLKHLKQEQLYRLHYQMITFGKVFCLKKNPNCRACPFKNECKYYKSLVDSLKSKQPCLAWTQEKRMINSKKGSRKRNDIPPNPFDVSKESSNPWLLPATASDPSLDAILPFQVSNLSQNSHSCRASHSFTKCEDGPIIEYPASPKKVEETDIPDIEDLLKDDAGEEFIVVKLKSPEFKQTPPDPYEENYVRSGSDGSSRALVSLSPEYASMLLPKHINPVRLRTEHQVYELPYDHPLLKNLDRQQGKIPYLLAIWTQGQNEEKGSALEGCSVKACSSENVPDDSLTVPGTLLIPVRTAMKGSFPLNGTYFQVNEVFADDETSENPINVPRRWIWRLRKRTLYCGSGTSSIFRGLTEEEIRRCCWEGYICTRGFDRQTRAPKLLPQKFHNRPHVKGKLQQDEEDD